MKECERSIQPCAAAINDGWMWVFDYNINALFRMELLSKKIEYVLSVQGEYAYQRALFTDILFYRRKMFLVANSAKENVLVDLDTMSQRKVHCNRQDKSTKTATPIQCGSQVYMFPKYLGDNIEIWDFEDEIVHEIKIDYSKVERYIELRELMWFGGVKAEDGFWLACGHSNKLVHIDKGGRLDICALATADKGFCTISIKGHILYLLPGEGSELVQYDIRNNKSKVLFDTADIFPNKYTFSYLRAIVIEDTVILIPGAEKQIVLINLASEEKRKWFVEERFCAYAQWKNKLFLFPELGEEWKIINLETQGMDSYRCNFPSICEGVPFYQYWMDDVCRLAGTKPDYSELICDVEQFLSDKHMNPAVTRSKTDHVMNGQIIWESLSSNSIK